jgi:hypothetical protein
MPPISVDSDHCRWIIRTAPANSARTTSASEVSHFRVGLDRPWAPKLRAVDDPLCCLFDLIAGKVPNLRRHKVRCQMLGDVPEM